MLLPPVTAKYRVVSEFSSWVLLRYALDKEQFVRFRGWSIKTILIYALTLLHDVSEILFMGKNSGHKGDVKILELAVCNESYPYVDDMIFIFFHNKILPVRAYYGSLGGGLNCLSTFCLCRCFVACILWLVGVVMYIWKYVWLL